MARNANIFKGTKIMARQKAEKANIKQKNVEKEYYEEVEFDCPVRGKIKQLVKVVRYRSRYSDPWALVAPQDTLEKLAKEGEVIVGSEPSNEEYN